MPETGVVVIGWWEVALASLFMLVAGAVSVALHLGLVRSLAVATLRTYLQLLVLGFALRWVFDVEGPWLVLGILALMVVTAARIVLDRSPDAPRGLFLDSVVSMSVVGFAVTFAVTGLVVRVQPWYEARYVIPIAGMVLGNSMNGIALTLERVFADLEARAHDVLALVALGATPWEAARSSVAAAVRAGLIPTINSMSAVGIVFIPGMMTGQVLAGVDPVVASGYQIVVMLMVSAATALGSILTVLLSYRKAFTRDGVYAGPGGTGAIKVDSRERVK
ncbi:MAG: iron export ABC transporter permease subunit FetB [Coriobacteriia bacterium]